MCLALSSGLYQPLCERGAGASGSCIEMAAKVPVLEYHGDQFVLLSGKNQEFEYVSALAFRSKGPCFVDPHLSAHGDDVAVGVKQRPCRTPRRLLLDCKHH